MGKFKKKQLYIGFLLLFFTVFIGTSESYCSEAFNYTSGDIVNLYTIMRDNSLYYSIENDTNYHNKVIQLWSSGDEFMANLSSLDFDLMAEELNRALQQVYIDSGEYNNLYGWNTTGMEDSNMWVVVTPSDRTTNPAKICMLFIPAVSNVVTGLENRANVSGDYVYSTTLTINKWNMDHTAVETATSQPFIGIVIDANGYNIYSNKNNSGVPYSTSIGYSLGSAPYWYRRELPNPYDEQNNIMYYIGLVYTHRTNDLFPSLNYKGYNFYSYKQVFNGFRYNLDNGIATSGDSTPTPTPVPTGSPGSGNVDLSETNSLISGVYEALTDDDFSGEFMSSGDFSGELINSLHLSTIDNLGDSFFLALWEGLRQALLSEDGKIYEVPFLDSSFIMDADVFIIDNVPLNSFFRIGSLVGFIMVEYKLLYLIFRTAQTGGFADIIRFLYHKDYTNFL